MYTRVRLRTTVWGPKAFLHSSSEYKYIHIIFITVLFFFRFKKKKIQVFSRFFLKFSFPFIRHSFPTRLNNFFFFFFYDITSAFFSLPIFFFFLLSISSSVLTAIVLVRIVLTLVVPVASGRRRHALLSVPASELVPVAHHERRESRVRRRFFPRAAAVRFDGDVIRRHPLWRLFGAAGRRGLLPPRLTCRRKRFVH